MKKISNGLRTTLWDMNEVDYRTETQRHEVDVPDEDGNVATETVSETVLGDRTDPPFARRNAG